MALPHRALAVVLNLDRQALLAAAAALAGGADERIVLGRRVILQVDPVPGQQVSDGAP